MTRACMLVLGSWVAVAACSSSGSDPAQPGGSAPQGPSARGDASLPGTTAAGEDGGFPMPTADAAADAAGGDASPAAVPYQHFDINHVLSTGQSNAVAIQGTPVLSTTQPYGNLMFDSGVMPASSCDGDGCTVYQTPTSLVPLVEGDRFFGPVETMSSGLANQASKMARERVLIGKPAHDILVSLHGRSGNNYWCLRKGGCPWWPSKSYVKPFDEALMQVADALSLAQAAGKSYVVRAATAVHGENDHYAYESGNSVFPLPATGGGGGPSVADYGHGLEEWQRDYEQSVKAITGQTIPVPLFIQQYSHWNNVPTTKIAYQQLAAHVRSNGKVVVVGPTYALPYSSDCLHFTGAAERHLGEYFAKAYARVVLEGRRWEPLRPLTITRAGNVVTAKFLVPEPPLVLDTQKVSDPGNYGFELVDGSASPPAITNVAITAPDTVQITLAAAPTGPSPRLRYAYTFHGCAGPGTTARGNLRDSDATPSQAGYDLANWAVHFDEPVQ